MKQRNFQDDYEKINPKLKKHFFSAQPTITSTYAGELALPYLAAALKSGKTLANNWITIKENIPYKAVLKNVTQANIIQNGACDWNEAGTTTLDERVLTVEEFMVNIELCKADFRQDWEAAATGSMFDDRIPPTFEEFLLSYVAKQVAQQMENTIWGGNNAAAGEFEGFATNNGIIVSGGGTNVTTSVAPTTGANVLTCLDELFTDAGGIMATTPAILDKEDFTIYVSPKVALLYQQKLASDGYLNEYYVNEKPLNYMGYQMVACPGMLNDRIIAAQKSNLVFGTNLMTDMTNIRVIDRSLIDGSDNVRMTMRYAAGIQAGIISECYCAKN
tara:strand:- start:603 stop:1595 length:993 start_codon:yes stop_codon:yes gene_type:complete